MNLLNFQEMEKKKDVLVLFRAKLFAFDYFQLAVSGPVLKHNPGIECRAPSQHW
jgi:hypothetical protein